MIRLTKKSLGRIRNNKGSLLIVSYLVIFVLISLGAAFVLVATNEGRVAERERRTYQAFYIAEAGIERAIYDLRLDFLNGGATPSWADGSINTIAIGPDTNNFYDVPYTPATLNGGSYAVQFKNISGDGASIWIRSAGTIGDETETIQVYVEMIDISPWNNAIFAGAGASGSMINGNVDIRGSVHVLGTGLASTDYVMDLGGTAEIVGNNYNDVPASLLAKIPNLPTTTFNGETVQTLNAVLRVKRGIVGLSGSSSVGQADAASNAVKETVDASYVTNGYGGTQGTGNVYSDNGWSNGYDLGDTVTFPSLSDPYPGYSSYQQYLRANALVVSDAASLAQLSNITPTSSFTFSGANGSISMDGSGNLSVSGIVYVEGGNLNFNKTGPNKTINYTGTGSILVTGTAGVNVNLLTSGNDSFPNNILGIMTPNSITFNEADIDVMGLFYGENTVTIAKQTNLVGTVVSNYFDMGTNVPSVFQVPEVVNHLPPGLIGQGSNWFLRTVSWQHL